MSPQIGEHRAFERRYVAKFKEQASAYGEILNYDVDYAAIDLGVHLTIARPGGSEVVSNARVWFQFKGMHAATMDRAAYERSADIPLELNADQLKFWYASPEPVYIVLYVESADVFLAEDILDIVERHWGGRILGPDGIPPDQKTATVRIRRTSQLDDALWRRMLSHRSMRIDGPLFRGRPLGHRLDPLRSIPNVMDPGDFLKMVDRLLRVHDYRISDRLDASTLFANGLSSGDEATLSVGRMYLTYEWTNQMFTEFLFDEDSDFRIEGRMFQVQGPCAVLVHSCGGSYPDGPAVHRLGERLAGEEGIKRLLVFANRQEDAGYVGSFFANVRGTGIECIPQQIGDLAFNLLTATSVYLDFRDKVSWRFVNYLY